MSDLKDTLLQNCIEVSSFSLCQAIFLSSVFFLQLGAHFQVHQRAVWEVPKGGGQHHQKEAHPWHQGALLYLFHLPNWTLVSYCSVTRDFWSETLSNWSLNRRVFSKDWGEQLAAGSHQQSPISKVLLYIADNTSLCRLKPFTISFSWQLWNCSLMDKRIVFCVLQPMFLIFLRQGNWDWQDVFACSKPELDATFVQWWTHPSKAFTL